jgi:hypothetical protein
VRSDGLLIVGLDDPVAADYAAYAQRGGARPANLIGDRGTLAAVVVFLKPSLSERDRATLERVYERVRADGVRWVGLVSSFRVHLGDPLATAVEKQVLDRVQGLGVRAVVFRAGHILSANSRCSALLRRLGCCAPLVPRHLRSCFVEGSELFAALERERQDLRPHQARFYTLLGANEPWQDLLARYRPRGLGAACLTAICTLFSLLCLGRLAGLVLDGLARRRPGLRSWNFDTLRPQSMSELLALYNPYNFRHVKVVGYNNGVIHFGQRFPGKTIVSTVHCNRIAWAGAGLLKADCGATIRQARDFLRHECQELFVVPNYSYVCLGTAFFVPIHGSASDCSTVADTITRVVLYDPVGDRLIAAQRQEPAFREHVYNMRTDVLLLRLYVRVKPKARYFVHKQELRNPDSAELVAALRDDRATNVEIRQASAGSDRVTVSKYYSALGQAPASSLELPRDALGRLWDRLEENLVTSFLMHALTRYFAWHVELFFTEEEFARFWQGHGELPVRKLQLRYIRRDGFPHSPFREHDCISVDLFMLRRHRVKFETYMKRNFAVIRTNPGKHSR